MWEIILLIFCIMCSALFSASETAFFSLSNVRLIHLVKSGNNKAKLVQQMKNNSHKFLITVLIGNNLVNTTASVLAATIADQLFGNIMIALVTGVMTFILLVFGEIVPKSIATVYNEPIILNVAFIIRMLSIILSPVVWFFDFLARSVINSFGSNKKKPAVTETEIKHFIEEGVRVGEIKASEEKMIKRIFKFDDIEVGEIMTPLPDVVAISSDTSLKHAVDFFSEHKFSRIPVYEVGHKETIIGVINLKQLMSAVSAKKVNRSVKSLMDPVLVIPSVLTCDKVLKQFQTRQQHLAIVVDEHGNNVGIVTLEDVMEEIVGEIVDETGKIERNIVRLNRNTWRVLGSTELSKFSDYFKLSLNEKIDNVSGFAISKIGNIPEEGDTFEIKRLKCEIEKVKNHRIVSIKVVKG